MTEEITPGGERSSRAPQVGIFWGLRGDGGPVALLCDTTAVSDAEPYGDFMTHPRGHYDIWEAWRQLGPKGLAARGLPPVIAWSDYDMFPRGRIVYHVADKLFTIYADRHLQGRPIITRLRDIFGLRSARCSVRSDPHYRIIRPS